MIRLRTVEPRFEDKDDITAAGKDENENCTCFVWLNPKREYYRT